MGSPAGPLEALRGLQRQEGESHAPLPHTRTHALSLPRALKGALALSRSRSLSVSLWNGWGWGLRLPLPCPPSPPGLALCPRLSPPFECSSPTYPSAYPGAARPIMPAAQSVRPGRHLAQSGKRGRRGGGGRGVGSVEGGESLTVCVALSRSLSFSQSIQPERERARTRAAPSCRNTEKRWRFVG